MTDAGAGTRGGSSDADIKKDSLLTATRENQFKTTSKYTHSAKSEQLFSYIYYSTSAPKNQVFTEVLCYERAEKQKRLRHCNRY